MKQIALAVAFGLALIPVAANAQATQKPMGEVTAVHGWIEDGIAHTPGTASADVKKSVAGGAPLVFVDDKSKQVYRIDNPEVAKGHEGHHISFNGSIDSVAKTVHFDSVSMLKNQKPGPEPEAVGH